MNDCLYRSTESRAGSAAHSVMGSDLLSLEEILWRNVAVPGRAASVHSLAAIPVSLHPRSPPETLHSRVRVSSHSLSSCSARIDCAGSCTCPQTALAPDARIGVRRERLRCAAIRTPVTAYAVQGLRVVNPAVSNGAVSRVATIMPLAAAVAAMYPSDTEIARPADRACAISPA